MKTAFVGSVLLAGLAVPVLGNGGAYHYGTKSTGSLNPFEAEGVEQVAIMEERLDIELEGSGAKVNVRYWMKHTGKKAVQVRFGFPVELPATMEMFWDGEKRPDTKERLATNLSEYQVWADGQEVKAAFREEKGTREEKGEFDHRLAEIAGWMVSEVRFAPGEERIVQISYRCRYDSAGSFVSNNIRNNAKVFTYRLSTGAVWKGPIRKGTVTVTAKEVVADEVEVFKPVGRFEREGATWTWRFENLEPTLADDIEIRAVPASNFYGLYGKGEERVDGYFGQAGIWSMVHRRYAARASSALAPEKGITYEAAHVGEWGRKDDFVAWAEGVAGDGIGEWLELRPAKATPLYALAIRPGYGKSEELFAANNRPASVEILLNDEHRFVARIDDVDQNQMVRVLGYEKPVASVRITVASVYPGSRHRDTCISYVTLYSRLQEKPKVRGAR